MHDHDFELLDRREADGAVEFTVRIRAANLERTYRQEIATGTIRLAGPPLMVGGYDMTSIIGKRVREWWGTGRTPEEKA